MRLTVRVSIGRLGSSPEEREEVEMMVDTGSDMCVISQEMANRLGIVPTDSKGVECICGERPRWPKGEFDTAYVREDGESIELSFPVLICPLPEEARRFDPILGVDVLDRWDVLADTRFQRLVPRSSSQLMISFSEPLKLNV